MNDWIFGILIGLGLGLVLVPLGIWIFSIIRNTLERRKIKRMIKNGQFLQPIDTKDFDSEKWKENIDLEKNKQELENLDKKLFSKKEQ